MKLLLLLSSCACLIMMIGAQETTDLPTDITLGPETTPDTENATDSTSTSSTETSEITTTALPDSTASSTTEESSTAAVTDSTASSTTEEPSTSAVTDSTASSTTEEPSTTVLSTTTSETPVETTTAVETTTDGNSTDCKDSTPALCKAFAKQLCRSPKRCDRKKGHSHEKSKEANKKDKKKSKERHQPIEPVENDVDDDGAVCAWARMQPHPELREVVEMCNQEEAATRLQFIKDGFIRDRRGPKPPKQPKDIKKGLDCHLRKAASVFFRLLCPATCNSC